MIRGDVLLEVKNHDGCVFECSVSPSDYLVLVHDLLKIANIDEDSLRFYKLGSRYADRIERYGRERSLPVNDVMMI